MTSLPLLKRSGTTFPPCTVCKANAHVLRPFNSLNASHSNINVFLTPIVPATHGITFNVWPSFWNVERHSNVRSLASDKYSPHSSIMGRPFSEHQTTTNASLFLELSIFISYFWLLSPFVSGREKNFAMFFTVEDSIFIYLIDYKPYWLK